MISCCGGTRSQGVSPRGNQLLNGRGTNARHRFCSKIFFEICGKPPGGKRFSATPDWMRTPKNSSNPYRMGQSCCINVQNDNLAVIINTNYKIHHYESAYPCAKVSIRILREVKAI